MSTTYAGPKLKRLGPGHYLVEGLGCRVFQDKGRTWSGRLGPHEYAEWYMLRETAEGFEKDSSGLHRNVLEASTLEGLKRKLERYFTPRVLSEN